MSRTGFQRLDHPGRSASVDLRVRIGCAEHLREIGALAFIRGMNPHAIAMQARSSSIIAMEARLRPQ
jgi:hypothetical protein